MKTLIKSAIILIAFGSSTTYAQKSSIDSPHNYKRPVFQQRKALSESNHVTVFSQSTNQIKNNISSVHNYKRQGMVDFTSEATFVIPMPATEPTSLNPLLSSNHYKSQFQTTEYSRQMVFKIGGLDQSAINITRTDSVKTALN